MSTEKKTGLDVVAFGDEITKSIRGAADEAMKKVDDDAKKSAEQKAQEAQQDAFVSAIGKSIAESIAPVTERLESVTKRLDALENAGAATTEKSNETTQSDEERALELLQKNGFNTEGLKMSFEGKNISKAVNTEAPVVDNENVEIDEVQTPAFKDLEGEDREAVAKGVLGAYISGAVAMSKDV